MTIKTKKCLSDIQEAIYKIELFTANINDFLQYKSDLKTKSAVERQLAIIGEALAQIRNTGNEVTILNSIQIIGLRNRLIHSYDSVEDTIVWAILKRHLPNLKIEINSLL